MQGSTIKIFFEHKNAGTLGKQLSKFILNFLDFPSDCNTNSGKRVLCNGSQKQPTNLSADVREFSSKTRVESYFTTSTQSWKCN